jgi:hypothetical protein
MEKPDSNCWLDKSAWPTPGDVYRTPGEPTPVLQLEFHGRPPATHGERRGFKRGPTGWKWVTWRPLGRVDRRRRGCPEKGATVLGRLAA